MSAVPLPAPYPYRANPRGGSRYPDRWKTREGLVMRIEAMADSHLANAVRWMERQAQELFDTGDDSWDCPEDMGPCMPPRSAADLLPPVYDHLLDEAERRGLKLEDLP